MRRVLGAASAALVLAATPVGVGAAPSPSASPASEIEMSAADVPFVWLDVANDDLYRPLAFERMGATFAALDPDLIDAASADSRGLLFTSTDDLGGFRPAPAGMWSWSSTGVALVGVDAPDVAEGDVLPIAGPPQLGRTTWSFLDDEVPPSPVAPSPPTEGINARPPPRPPRRAPMVPTTVTSPAVPATSTTGPASGSDSTPRTDGAPATTVVPTTTRPTTDRPQPSTTTRPPTTVLAPGVGPSSPSPLVETLALSQERSSATACVAPTGGTADCDAVWAIPLAATGESHTFDLTLRNTGDSIAAALELWASSACVTTSTMTPSGTGDLCDVIELTVQRYTTSARDVPLECVYGGGTAQVCSLSSARTLRHFSTTYASANQARLIGGGLVAGEAAHLRLTLRLPDVDNRYQRRAATIGLTWRLAN